VTDLKRLLGGLDRPITRRELLRRAGRGSVFLGGMTLLAACGVEAQRQEGGDTMEPLPQDPAGTLIMANWPAYIDRAEGTHSPTIESFQEQTGITMQYKVVINDNAEFFGVLHEPLSQGQSTGYDIVVLTDWVIDKMNRLGYLERLHHDQLPNFAANAGEKFRDPWYDPGNAHSIPWAAGITGIGYDVGLTGRELTKFEDLFADDLAGRVGLFSEARDTFSLQLLTMGIEPQEATVEDVEAAQQALLQQRDKVRGFYGNDYLDQLGTGNLAASMAWSGDVFALSLDNPNLRFIVPEAGGMRWTDNMVIPSGAEHPLDAHMFMDFVYDPRIGANITEWVWYESPVGPVQDLVLQDAEEAQGADKELLLAIGNSPLVFPTPETNAQTHPYKRLDEEEEQIWNDLFQELVQG
jgi:spermidine/putrescine transport system substrate-binding protein